MDAATSVNDLRQKSELAGLFFCYEVGFAERFVKVNGQHHLILLIGFTARKSSDC